MDSGEVTLLVIDAIGAVIAATGSRWQERRSSTSQLSAVQRKLDLMLDHLGVAIPEETEVIRHRESGQTIEAVRAYRRLTGASPLDAKQAVDRIAAGRDRTER